MTGSVSSVWNRVRHWRKGTSADPDGKGAASMGAFRLIKTLLERQWKATGMLMKFKNYIFVFNYHSWEYEMGTIRGGFDVRSAASKTG